MRALHRIVLIVSALLLTACAGPRLIDSTVSSFPQWPHGQPFAPATYRFERLPSQNTPKTAPAQEQIEGLARSALARVGLQPESTSPQYSVQVQALIEQLATDPVWMPGWGAWGAMPGRDYVVNARGQVIWTGMALSIPEPILYRREVSLVIRQISTGAVVFESRAHSEGPGIETTRVLTAMFAAALAGYPTPPSGPRQVLVETAP